ncbi:S-DNA-T family DNA segregation ATPase FtsK/SpoIIIE [Streptomyces sp. 846.5]|nr:FtsK/SpoIIIE domain-containing protein [Streptomyces sp. 846.5]TDU06491.1 S-DNA-T family DNA segregation ATPase FtsK/SpoIIIE [Streptomyces sp. 846.5]
MSRTPTPAPTSGGIIGPGAYLQQPALAHHSAVPGVLLVLVCGLALALAVGGPLLRRRYPLAWWYLLGFPVTALRALFTWRKLTILLDLAVARRPAQGLLGDLVVKGKPLKPIPPRLGLPRPRRGGLDVVVKLHPGQVPDQFAAAAEALAHAWRVFAVRVVSHQRGFVRLTATAWDPLAAPTAPFTFGGRLLAAAVGQREDGAGWVIDLRKVPHWLIVGATRSGKSTLLASLVEAWARQRVALVGIDLKGGMELSLFEPRLSALATNRTEAAALLGRLVEITTVRMALCRSHSARSIWDLPDQLRPVPVIVLVDEVAELYLMATRGEKDEVAEVSTALLRLAQLGAALGVHLVIAGQRVGSDLGPGVTALRAQLAGRICHRVNDPGTAEMALGDLDKDALTAAQQITQTEAGVAITFGDDGHWTRARSVLTTPEHARKTATKYAQLAPYLWQLGAATDTEQGVYAP